MEKVDYIIIHCSDTEAGRPFTAADIDRWHRQRGFLCIGYHFVIRLDGQLEQGRVLSAVGAHCLHHNHHSIGICYIGGRKNGRPCDTRTPEQKAQMRQLVQQLLVRFPNAKVRGHRDFNPYKACPCFDVRSWWENG